MYCSVIIPTDGAGKSPRWILSMLLALQTERDFEAVVVCDGEDDAHSRALARRYNASYPISWIFNPSKLGPHSARNIGASRAQGEVIVFLDDDCLPDSDWLQHHCKHHRQNADEKKIVILGPIFDKYVHPPQSTTERMLREERARTLDDFYGRCMRSGRDLSWFPECGMNSSIRRMRDFPRQWAGSMPALRYRGGHGAWVLAWWRRACTDGF